MKHIILRVLISCRFLHVVEECDQINRLRMPSETTMDLNETQVANASKALITHLKKQDDDDLLAEDRKIYLALTLSVMPKKALKAPRRLYAISRAVYPQLTPVCREIPHSMFAYDSAEICFICKDGDIDYEELVASSGMKNVTVTIPCPAFLVATHKHVRSSACPRLPRSTRHMKPCASSSTSLTSSLQTGGIPSST